LDGTTVRGGISRTGRKYNIFSKREHEVTSDEPFPYCGATCWTFTKFGRIAPRDCNPGIIVQSQDFGIEIVNPGIERQVK